MYLMRLRTGLKSAILLITFPNKLLNISLPSKQNIINNNTPFQDLHTRSKTHTLCRRMPMMRREQGKDGYCMMRNNLQMSNKGRLNVGQLLVLYVPFIILTPFYCYYKAVSQHQEKPFPSATITQTACHYPQDIAFRYFMLIASSILALIFFMLFKWVSNVARDAHFQKPISSILYKMSMFSILLYGVTIGTIDERGTGPLHSPCAVGFFVILIWSIVDMTLYLTEMRQFDTRVISRLSLLAKQLLAVYLVVLWVYCLIMIISLSDGDGDFSGKSDKYVVIVEWNTVTIGLLWVLSFCWQWKDMNLVLLGPKNQNYHCILTAKDHLSQEMRKVNLMMV